MIGSRGVRCLAFSLVAAFAGCASSRPQTVDFSDATKSYRSDDYPVVFESWTRHYKLVQDIGTVLEVWGTLSSGSLYRLKARSR